MTRNALFEPNPPSHVEAWARILIITGDLSGHADGARSVRELITSLRTQVRHCELTLRVTDRPSYRHPIGTWERPGFRIVTGPLEPATQPGPEWGSYSHAIVTRSGAQAGAMRWLEATQPQAARVMFLSGLAFREVAALTGITPADELAGLEFARSCVEGAHRFDAARADAVWCEDARDADYLSAVLTGRVALLPAAIEPVRAPLPLSARDGVVVTALDGHDVVAGTEDAAMRALVDVLPQLRWRRPGLPCSLVADNPTPMLECAAHGARARVVPSTELFQSVASARLLVAAHGHGTGHRRAVMECLKAGTPFVATPQSVGGLDLGEAAPLVVHTDDVDLATQGRQLLGDDERWLKYATALRRLTFERYSPERRSAAVRDATATLGLETRPSDNDWTDAAACSARPTARRSIPVNLRPAGFVAPAPLSGPPPGSERDRYQLWVERFGPNPDAQRAIREDVRRLARRPIFSMLMTVHDGDLEALSAAVASVRAQIYDRWQLCIADHGSDQPLMRRALHELRGSPGIAVIDGRGQTTSEALNAALAQADGEFVACMEPDGRLKPHALAQMARWLETDPDLDLIYSDEDVVDDEGRLSSPCPKPDWSPDELLSHDYIGHLAMLRRSMVEKLGGFRSDLDGSHVYDLVLRLTEQTDRVGHIPEPLYSARAAAYLVPSGEAATSDAATVEAIEQALARRGAEGWVEPSPQSSSYRVRYGLGGRPRVSIIIPTKDRVDLLGRCINSVVGKSTYANYEIIIVDNQSTDGATLSYLAAGPWSVIRYPHRFNYARMVNLAARLVECDAYLFLNNDTEVITPDWIEALLEHAMRPEVGAVGPRLYFGDGRVQHEGIIVGAWHDWATNLNHGGFQRRGEIVRNTSAVTGACTMIRPAVYWRMGGADERLRVAYNDVDLCMRIRQAGYQIVYTPYAELYHHEGSSRQGYQHHEDGPLLGARWHAMDTVDPYYGPVLSNDAPFQIRV